MSKFVVMASWDDVPHLSKEQKDDLWKEIPEYQRDARSKGIPQLGSGAVYPIQEDEIKVKDFQIPPHWKRLYGFDVGWNWTAAVWLAINPDDKVTYIYSIYKKGKAEPVVHTEAINGRGDWIPGAVDPAAQGSSQIDGRRLVDEYATLGLNLYFADNGVETGLLKVWQALSSGRLKIFQSCLPWFEEFRLYRRDEKGKIVKTNDHLMDASRYGMGSLDIAEEQPDPDAHRDHDINTQTSATAGWY